MKIFRKILLILLLCSFITFLFYTPNFYTNQQITYTKEFIHSKILQKPQLALESTILTHGMPYPINYQLQLELEKICYDLNVTPVLISVYNGKIHYGSNNTYTKQFIESQNVYKVSSYDLPFVLQQNRNASTTVAATSFLADLADIKVFSTGGIGGVHRIEQSHPVYDISADLQQLSKTNCIVITAGCKSILDIPNTAEYLETLGVLTIGYKTNEMPAFYSTKSGVHLDYQVNNIQEINMIRQQNVNLDRKTGFIVFNPIPKEYELNDIQIEEVIQKAIKSKPENITGKAVTPYLLSQIAKISGNQSVVSNIELVKNNVKLGCQIAQEIYQSQNKALRFMKIISNPILLLCVELGINQIQKIQIIIVLILSVYILVKMSKRIFRN